MLSQELSDFLGSSLKHSHFVHEAGGLQAIFLCLGSSTKQDFGEETRSGSSLCTTKWLSRKCSFEPQERWDGQTQTHNETH